MIWLVLDVNPEAWRVGPLSVGRKKGGVYPRVGQDPQLNAYKEAVNEAARYYLEQRGISVESVKIDGFVKLHMYFWRRQDVYESSAGRKVRKHEVDLTNMVKATEDALQGIFYDNDKRVVTQRNHMVDQGPDVVPLLVIGVEWTALPGIEELPGEVVEEVRAIIEDEPRRTLFDTFPDAVDPF